MWSNQDQHSLLGGALGRRCLEPKGQARVGDRAGECRGRGIREGRVIDREDHCRETEEDTEDTEPEPPEALPRGGVR